jgi:hypothetical protein
MATNLTNFRLAINKELWSATVQDQVAQGPVVVPMGAALQFDLAFSEGAFNDSNILDLSNYSAIVFEILTPSLASAPISVTVAADDFQTCTADEFNAGTAQQLSINIGSTENLLTSTNGAPANYVLVCYGVNNDTDLGNDIFCSFQISSKATGVGTPGGVTLSGASLTRGATTLAAGTSSGSVALNLAYVPTMIVLTMQMPDGNGNVLVPNLAGVPTAASFDFVLSAQTDRVGYVLHWEVLQ